MDAHAADTPERVVFLLYERIGRDGLAPLWTFLTELQRFGGHRD